MKKIISIIFVMTLLMLVGCQTVVQTTPTQPAPAAQPTTPTPTEPVQTTPTPAEEEPQTEYNPTEPEGILSADEVDVIPDIDLSECLSQIKQTNPEMSDTDANDNCNVIEAINKADKSLCDRVVNANIKSACLAQFS